MRRNPHWSDGIAFGVLGMLGFSGTMVATRVAVVEISPLTITCARIVVAGLLGALTLFILKKLQLPERRFLPGIVWMGLGLSVGFPFFLTLALVSVPAVHGAVVTGLAPAATAILSVMRTGERPPLPFWIACIIGFCGVFYFALDAGGGHLVLADGWLFLALMCVGTAYVEGGRIAGVLGGTTTLCWAMIFMVPGALIVLLWSARDLDLETISQSAWMGLSYVCVISMFLASLFWYRGLAAGGIARIGQINLLLPLVALVWSAVLLNEEITMTAIVCSVVVFAAMIFCLKSRIPS